MFVINIVHTVFCNGNILIKIVSLVMLGGEIIEKKYLYHCCKSAITYLLADKARFHQQMI